MRTWDVATPRELGHFPKWLLAALVWDLMKRLEPDWNESESLSGIRSLAKEIRAQRPWAEQAAAEKEGTK